MRNTHRFSEVGRRAVTFFPLLFPTNINLTFSDSSRCIALHPPVVSALGDELLELRQSNPLAWDGDAVRDRLATEVVTNNRHIGRLLALFPPDNNIQH